LYFRCSSMKTYMILTGQLNIYLLFHNLNIFFSDYMQ
jgi:hypothetical protein